MNHPSTDLFRNSNKMVVDVEMREEFIVEFLRRITRNMLDGGMIKGKYPDIEKIKRNIKIYEKPESTIANAILMNQNPAIQKIMAFSETPSEEKPNIVSIMGKKTEDFIPLPGTTLPIPRIIQPKIIQRPPRRNLPVRAPFSQPMPFMHKQSGMRTLPSMARPVTQPINNQPMQSSVASPEKATLLGLERIDGILADPAVQTIECPGPNKPMLIYRSGIVQSSKMTLTGDEINNIMKEISEKTRIPLMSGVFKAAFGNLVITAVMSEFVGTRFMVQKKISAPQAQ